MSSIAKKTTRSKKTKRLGPGKILRPEEYADFEVATKIECIQALIPLGLMRIHELLEDEGQTLAGLRHQRKASSRLVLQDDELYRIHQCLDRGALCQSRSLDKLEAAAAVVGHSVAG